MMIDKQLIKPIFCMRSKPAVNVETSNYIILGLLHLLLPATWSTFSTSRCNSVMWLQYFCKKKSILIKSNISSVSGFYEKPQIPTVLVDFCLERKYWKIAPLTPQYKLAHSRRGFKIINMLVCDQQNVYITPKVGKMTYAFIGVIRVRDVQLRSAVGPRAKLHVTGLNIKRKVFDVDRARRLE